MVKVSWVGQSCTVPLAHRRHLLSIISVSVSYLSLQSRGQIKLGPSYDHIYLGCLCKNPVPSMVTLVGMSRWGLYILLMGHNSVPRIDATWCPDTRETNQATALTTVALCRY